MAAQETIKEYGVKLGFKVDDGGEGGIEHKMTLAIAKGKTLAWMFVSAVEHIGKGIENAVKMSDKLYWLSKHTGMSADDIEKITFYAKSLGASAEEAEGAIQGLSDAIKSDRGVKAAIEQYTGSVIKATDVTGENFEAIARFFKKLKSQNNEEQARIFAGEWHIPKAMFEAMIAEHKTYTDQFEEKLALSPRDKNGEENAHKFILQLVSLQTTVKLMFTRIASDIVKDKDHGLQKLIDYLDEHAGEIADTLAGMAVGMADFGRMIATWIVPMDKFINKTIGWKWAFAILVATMIALRLGMKGFLKSLLWWASKYALRFLFTAGTIGGIAGPVAAFGAAMSGGSAPETEEFKKYDEKQMEKSEKGYGTLGNLGVNLWRGNGFTTANPNEISKPSTSTQEPSQTKSVFGELHRPDSFGAAPQQPATATVFSKVKSFLTTPLVGSSEASTAPATPPHIPSLPVPPLPPPVPAAPPVNMDGGRVSVEGNQPTALDHINKLGPEELRGKTITISPGTSGGPHTMQQVREQVDAMIAKGANPASIRIIGAGGSPAMNSSLESFAKEKGFMYTAPGSRGKKNNQNIDGIPTLNIHPSAPAIGAQSKNEVRVKTVHHMPVTNTYNVYGDSDNVGGVVASNIEANSKRLKKAFA
jgi:hypothetical protein